MFVWIAAACRLFATLPQWNPIIVVSPSKDTSRKSVEQKRWSNRSHEDAFRLHTAPWRGASPSDLPFRRLRTPVKGPVATAPSSQHIIKKACPTPPPLGYGDRKRAAEGKSVSVRVDLGSRRSINKKNGAHTSPCAQISSSRIRGRSTTTAPAHTRNN